MAPKSEESKDSQTAAESQMDWTQPLETAVVPTLRPSRTVDSIPATIRQVIDKSHADGTILQVKLPNGIAAKAFRKHARDYGYLHDPRLTVRVTVHPENDDKTVPVSFKAVTYTEPVKETAESK